jgi:hypothetical protein
MQKQKEKITFKDFTNTEYTYIESLYEKYFYHNELNKKENIKQDKKKIKNKISNFI